MILRLHHAQITAPVGAEAAARQFYCGVLGLPEVPKPESLAGHGGFWLAVGDQQVHVGMEGGVDRAATKAHLAYEVLDSVPIPGFARFEFRDPFGSRVELIEAME